MDNFTYCTPTRYDFGRGAEDKLSVRAAEHGMTRVLLVYGKGSVIRSGLLGRLQQQLEKNGIEFRNLGGVQPNPTDDLVRQGIKMVHAGGLDGIIAVGGGSVIDTAKAVAAGAVYDGDFWDFFSDKAVINNALPIGVVLTIPAAGSEGSGNSVITNTVTNQKVSLRTDFWLRPKFALLDPELTMTLPAYQSAAGIVDMMAHIFERYFTPAGDVEVTDRISEGLIRAIMDQGLRVMQHPDDYQARANIMWAGTLAHNGLCGCGHPEDWASHGMEHELSALYGVTHGAGLAVVNPAWMTFMAEHRPAKVAQMARRIFDVHEPDDRLAALAGIARLRDFYRKIGMPTTLAELGIANPDIPELVKRVHITKGDPFGVYYPLRPADSEAIYRLML